MNILMNFNLRKEVSVMADVMAIFEKLWNALVAFLQDKLPAEVMDFLGQIPMPIEDDMAL